MLKKVFIVWIIVGIFSILTGCSQVKNIKNEENNLKNEEKIIANQTAQKKVNEIKNSAVPDFSEIYDSTVEIDVNFDSNGMYSKFKTIKISDYKLLSDILTMIGKSQVITNEIKKMSGIATENNSLTLIASDGSKREIKFAFDHTYALGYLEINDSKYDPGFSFFRYIVDLTEYQQFDTNIDNQVEELFRKYNWTIDYRVNTNNVTLPSNLEHEAGEYPVKIYWAYNNELSKNIGLDYKDYLGKEVEVDIYRLREPLPDYMAPRMNSRGIVIKYDNKIVGAYIDAGRHDCFACSLDSRSLEYITNKKWDNWIRDYINYDNELEMKLAKMNPEEVIKEYYKALNRHDQKIQFACMTRQNVCDYLSMNMDNNLLTNAGFDNAFVNTDGPQNIKSAKLISLHETSGAGNPVGNVEYDVTVYLKFNKEVVSSNGIQSRFIILKKESDKSGWRIQSEGTGP